MHKYIIAISTTLLITAGTDLFNDIFWPEYVIPHRSALDLSGSNHSKPSALSEEEFAKLVTAANIDIGKQVFKKCQQCHILDKENPNNHRIGPNLAGVVDEDIASRQGFNYSKSLQDLRAQAKKWDIKELNAFLASPSATAPNTKMTFPGLKDAKERAAVINYLQNS